MPQSTNLNKNPYYDDFTQNSNYYKVLFKPGVTVQARELTTLQSILQNQIERFGSKFFSNGSGQVIPGGFAYDNAFYSIEIESEFKGLTVEDYFKNFIGKILVGKTTGVTAKVYSVITKEESTRNSTTIFVKYQSSDGTTFEGKFFDVGEELLTQVDISVGDSFIFSGESVAKISSFTGRSPFSVGASAQINSGVYFVRGYFVGVEPQLIILDQYNNIPSCRVGLSIFEDIVDSNEDPDLNDNAQGFSNYAAPGADRFSVTLTLSKKAIDDFNDDNFIELFRVKDGVVQSVKNETVPSFVEEVLARRTFDESGNYTVDNYDVDATDSLNDRVNYFGLYSDTSKTPEGSTPTEDLGVIKISPGKSYVKGYEVLTNQTNLDYPKPRTTSKIKSASATFYAGNKLKLNNATNVPTIGLDSITTLRFYNQRLGIGSATQGDIVAFARAYDYECDNSPFEGQNSIFNLYIIDLQTFTKIQTKENVVSVGNGFHVQGQSSGSSGYVYNSSGDIITIYQASGKFIQNENLIVNGILSSNAIGTVTDYSIRDLKSVEEAATGFVADVVLSKETTINGPFFFSSDEPTGICTITKLSGGSFADKLKIGDIISYDSVGFNTSIYVGVTSIFPTQNKIQVVGVTSVFKVNNGDVGIGTYTVQNIKLKYAVLENNQDSSLYTPLSRKNISNVDFLNSNLYVRKQYTSISKNAGTINLPDLSGSNYVYSSFDEERYIVIQDSTGNPESLTSDNFSLSLDGKTAQITGLTGSDTCTIITTQQKTDITAKSKKLNKVQTLTITTSKYSPVKNAGVSFSSIYGLRVEDPEISLNKSDIVEVHGVFESQNNDDPTIPWISLTGLNTPTGTTDDLIIGDYIIGSTSGAVALYAGKKNPSEVNIIYKNDNIFSVGETIKFKESQYSADVATVNVGSPNILNEYSLDNGQRKTFYDIGRLIRNVESKEPSGRLKIYFDYFSYESTDNGDIISANSYPSKLYGTKIPVFDGYRNTDIIDIRPRVTFTSSGNISPFDFRTRTFDSSGQTAGQILVSYENVIFDYDFYLPRTDKLVLDKTGDFSLIFGEPSETPIAPSISSEVLDIATIIASPYIYDIENSNEISILLSDNRRYTMSDLRNIESRVEDLEYYTSLSILETSTQNLLVEDENGLNRFKSGFFVDNFTSSETSDLENSNYRAFVVNGQLTPELTTEKIDLTLYPTDFVYNNSEINISDTSCSNLSLTGTTLTLNYTQVEYTNQPFASKIVNVNPYAIVSWKGNLNLSPMVDTWTVKKVTYTNVIGRGPTTTTTTNTPATYARSRNINFDGTVLKPTTKYNMIFDSKNLSDNSLGLTYAFPKILEISSVKGAFKVGETVVGRLGSYSISFRVCTPNHKTGPHDNPTTTFSTDPYNPTVGISTLYGSASTILNIDLETLQVRGTTKFYGNALTGMKLSGRTSKASATITQVRLITDTVGDVYGSIWIPEPTVKSNPKFKNGSLNAKLESVFDTTLGNLPGQIPSFAETTLTTAGIVKNVKVTRYYDPLAQSFEVPDPNGIFPTSVDIYFQSKDKTLPVTLQIREMVNGTPGGDDKIVSGLVKSLLPENISISNNGTSPTTFTFDKLVRLEGSKEYALVLMSESNEYNVWVSEVGQVEISTLNSASIDKIYIGKQPALGSLFKSQNSSTWTACQLEDLKFKLNRADFITTGGTARFYNTKVETVVPENKLPENPIYTYSNTEATPFNDGRHVLVFHPNHGMSALNNKVNIQNVFPDTISTKTTVAYGLTETGPISVGDTSSFANYNGSPVGPDNLGYALMNNEIIRYNEFAPGQLKNIQRATQDTVAVEHSIQSVIYKYEFNGVPLNKINTTHDILDSPAPTLDQYYIQIGAGSTFGSTKFGGGDSVYATKNKIFSKLELAKEFVVNPPATTASASVRTISATSVDSNEVSFVDQGYQSIDILNDNNFNTLRMVASYPNESEYLNATQFIGNKSLTVDFVLNTTDSNVSPIIELDQLYATIDSYRIDNPIGINSYTTDSRVNSNINDPHGFIHITKKINLQETANSIKVILTAYRPAETEIRALYKIYRNDSPEENQVWELFPGYDNLDSNGLVVNSNNNNGRPDKNVAASLSDEFKEYTFSINNLSEFTGFAIKLVATTTNQAIVPIIEDIRAIALK
jgi:hypothetical protein